MFFRMVYKSGQIFLPFCHNSRVWWTDGRTDRNLITIPRLHYMQRGKNTWKTVHWRLMIPEKISHGQSLTQCVPQTVARFQDWDGNVNTFCEKFSFITFCIWIFIIQLFHFCHKPAIDNSSFYVEYISTMYVILLQFVTAIIVHSSRNTFF